MAKKPKRAGVANHVGYQICVIQGLLAGAKALANVTSDERFYQIQYCIDAANERLEALEESVYEMEAGNG